MKKVLRYALLVGLILALGIGMVACSSNDGGNQPADVNQQPEGNNEEEGHSHDVPFEWSGIFEFKEGLHTMKFNKNEGDESMLIAFISVDGQIDDIEHHSAHIAEAGAIEVEKNGQFEAENEYAYNLALDPDKTEVTFELKTPGKYYVFTEHLPVEFDLEIIDSDGTVLVADEPTEYDDDHDHEH